MVTAEVLYSLSRLFPIVSSQPAMTQDLVATLGPWYVTMTRDLFKKIRDTKGTFHAKMGPIKDRNGMDLTEAEDIKKRWQDRRTEQKRYS